MPLIQLHIFRFYDAAAQAELAQPELALHKQGTCIELTYPMIVRHQCHISHLKSATMTFGRLTCVKLSYQVAMLTDKRRNNSNNVTKIMFMCF